MNGYRVALLLVASVLLVPVVPGAALAQQDRFSSPINSAFELKLGRYVPSIDAEFESPGPFETTFGSPGLYIEGEYNRQFYRGFGSLAVGMNVGYLGTSAGSLTEDGERAADRTRFTMLPLRLGVVYRFDVLQNQFNVPLVPSFKLGLDYAFWWVGDGDGTASSDEDGGVRRGRGGTAGYHASIGLHLWLNWFAPGMARTFDVNTGVNNSYLFVEYLVSRLDDFGSSSSWDLGDNALLFGISFEF
ncbi:MAG: hypothetical protein EA398_10145 [Deltaproteobacteria bacterium]|nr:MAG: hypothetical protein EA398_10145 [Deltaproteobacteria bacterium]